VQPHTRSSATVGRASTAAAEWATALPIENMRRRRGAQGGVAGRGPRQPGVDAAGRKVPPSGHVVHDPIFIRCKELNRLYTRII